MKPDSRQRNVKFFSPSISDSWLFECPFCHTRQETKDMRLPVKCWKCWAVIKVIAVKEVRK